MPRGPRQTTFRSFRGIADADEALGPIAHVDDATRAAIMEWQRTDRSYEVLQMMYREPEQFAKLSSAERSGAYRLDALVGDAVAAGPLPSNMVLYRGVRDLEGTFGKPVEEIVGHEDEFPGYLATSVLESVAREEFTGPKGALIVLHVPAGIPGLWVAGVGIPALKRQGELLFDHDLSYRVFGSGFTSGVPVLFVQVIP